MTEKQGNLKRAKVTCHIFIDVMKANSGTDQQ